MRDPPAGTPGRDPPEAMRPVIGISTREIPGERIRPGVEAFVGRVASALRTDYAAMVRRAGGAPVLLPSDLDPADAVRFVDAVLIPGGEDVDPRWYGHAPEEGEDLDDDRDVREFALVTAAVHHGLPVLGICRGAQLVNVTLGGELADAPASDVTHAAWDGPLTRTVHDVVLERGAPLPAERMHVNSAHHQMIAAVGDDLVAVAHAPDGVIEAVMCPRRAILGVQWHPECLDDLAVADWLVRSAAARHRTARAA